jgi:hypothetical protein
MNPTIFGPVVVRAILFAKLAPVCTRITVIHLAQERFQLPEGCLLLRRWIGPSHATTVHKSEG